jgi:concentrative nucleoside transporter, CNT family
MLDATLPRLHSLLGLIAMIAMAWAMSTNRRQFPWRVVIGGLILQLVLAAAVLWTEPGRWFFAGANSAVEGFQQFVSEGSSFVFGLFPDSADKVGGDRLFPVRSFAFGVLPTVIVFSSLMSVLYHLGVMQVVVRGVAFVMQKSLGTSGPETLAAAANIFVGQTEAPLVVKPYLATMTRSELNALLVGGFATITGSLIVGYASMGVEAGHLITASVISGPAALVVAKLMVPEESGAVVERSLTVATNTTETNLIGAAVEGASDGMKLALNIAAMLIAFLALLAMADFALGQIGALFGLVDPKGVPTLTITNILGYVFAPLAWLIGVPWSESMDGGKLLGIKMFANEFVAYQRLGEMLEREQPISERTKHLMTYALCGFSNFSSIGIQIGGIGSLAPERRNDIAKLGVRAMIGGTIACLMTACIAGMLL